MVNITGGKGKSNALNIALDLSKGEYLAIYDADNTPESKALKYLVQTIEEDKQLGAVIGKFRCRNKKVNMLTAFINIETLAFQWMSQAGRWQFFNLCTIPGTNFIIRRSLIEEMGGWDTKAVTEDTEISFRLYRMGYKIKFKFRCRNKKVNMLTAFINIETLAFQWMSQAGRWQFFNLCTIPGTNFIIRRSLIEEMGGWDTKAVTEDTEISFRLYRMGYKIKFMPLAVTWEQEPQTLKVWFKQRTRWAKGNIYVVLKNVKYIFARDSGATRFDIAYYVMVYFFFLSANIISDLLFILSMMGIITLNIEGYGIALWVMAVSVFILSLLVCISTEKGELTLKNYRKRRIDFKEFLYYSHNVFYIL